MILKLKIAKARQLSMRLMSKKVPGKRGSSTTKAFTCQEPKDEVTSAQKHNKILRSKNVFKNYTRAICNFIISDISNHYLLQLIEEFDFDIEEFKAYIREKKEGIKGIIELRGLLVVQAKDTLRIVSFKRVFQRIAEIFIKYFSVNWIFSSKLEYKLDYLKFRYSILRRIKRPILLDSSQI